MSDEQSPSPAVAPSDRTHPLARRSFLGSIAGLGASTVAPSAAGQSWPTDDDPYFAALASDLEDRGLPPGEFLLGDTEAEVLDAYAVGGAVETTAIDAPEELPFREAMRLSVAESVSDPWDALLKASGAERALEQGDVLLGVAYLRAAPTDDTDPETDADGTIQYLAKDADDEATNQVVNGTQPVLDSEWRRYEFQIRSQYDSAAGDWWTELFLGYGAQTIDVGGMALLHFGDAVSPDALPDWNTDHEYVGRADDAAWRSAAHDRIEAIRRGPLSVTVTDDAGDPIPDAEVAVEMQAHEFDFGAAVAVDRLTSNETYQETFLENFETAVIENGLKDRPWAGEAWAGVGRENTEAAVDWLNEHGVPTRGHTLLWASYDHTTVTESQSTDEIVAEIEDSIRERAAAMEGRLSEWDMHNHPVMFDSITEDVGRETILDWWAAATEEDPATPMWVNEGSVLSTLRQNREAYYDYVDWLTGTGTDVAGIGFMGHFGVDYLRPPAEILEIFDEFAAFGLPLKVTELDVALGDPDDEAQIEAQRDYLRDVLIAAYSHEAVEGVLQWGFWAGSHWQPSAALFDEDWSIRPHGEAYRQLVFEEWWTDEAGSTDDDGSFATDAYLGTYEVTATVDGQQTVETVVLDDPDAGASVTIAVDDGSGDPSDCGGDAGADSETLGDGSTVCDVDGDGQYMDVTGDGSVTNSDVTQFFRNQHASPWDDRAALFDFDGDDAVGQSDVVALFESVAG